MEPFYKIKTQNFKMWVEENPVYISNLSKVSRRVFMSKYRRLFYTEYVPLPITEDNQDNSGKEEPKEDAIAEGFKAEQNSLFKSSLPGSGTGRQLIDGSMELLDMDNLSGKIEKDFNVYSMHEKKEVVDEWIEEVTKRAALSLEGLKAAFQDKQIYTNFRNWLAKRTHPDKD